MRPFILIIAAFLALLNCPQAMGQGMEKMDSLLSASKTGNAKDRSDAFNRMSMLVLYNDPVLAKRYAVEAIELSRSVDFKFGELKGWMRIGIVHDISGNYDSSITCYNLVVDLSKQTKDDKNLGSAYNNIGLVYKRLGQFSKALSYFMKALPLFEKIDHKLLFGNVYNNIAMVYESLKESHLAIAAAYKALDYYRQLDDVENIGGTYTNLSISYSNLNHYDSSIYYITKAIECHQKSNNLYGLSTAYNDYGAQLTETKQFDKAKDYYFKALKIKEELGEYEGIAATYVNLSFNYKKQGDYPNMLLSLSKGLALARKHHLLNEIRIISLDMADFYRSAVKNADSVFHYMNLYDAVKDSTYTKELKQSLAEAQARYKTKEKELTIQKQQNQLYRKNYYIAGLILLMVLSLLAFYAFYNRYRMKQRSRMQEEIMRQQDMATKAVIRAEENERRRVASDLHDSVGQMLSAVKLNLSSLSPNILPANAPKFEKIMDMVDESCKEVRAISHNMMPNSLLKNGLVSAVREFIGQLNHTNLVVNVETSGLNERLDDNVETVLYRIVQECVNNVVKHANASRLDIQMIKDREGIAITIEDNGIGFDPGAEADGIGLKNLRSRIGFLKGHVDISSSPGKGALIAIFIPQQNKS